MEDIPSTSDVSHLIPDSTDSRFRFHVYKLSQAENAFKRYVEGVTQRKILEELKQFCSRGELEVDLDVWPHQINKDKKRGAEKDEGIGKERE